MARSIRDVGPIHYQLLSEINHLLVKSDKPIPVSETGQDFFSSQAGRKKRVRLLLTAPPEGACNRIPD